MRVDRRARGLRGGRTAERYEHERGDEHPRHRAEHVVERERQRLARNHARDLRLRELQRVRRVRRRALERLRELRDRLAAQSGYTLSELSMGMTDDFEVAIEEGATIVRVGRAVFGERQ